MDSGRKDVSPSRDESRPVGTVNTDMSADLGADCGEGVAWKQDSNKYRKSRGDGR